ncbi:MAG TPA: WD40 repeat domain-containing protein [Pyrinomonadaceae bacterium]
MLTTDRFGCLRPSLALRVAWQNLVWCRRNCHDGPRSKILSRLGHLPGLLFIAFVLSPFPGLAVTTSQAGDNSQTVVKLSRTLDPGAEVDSFAVSPDGKLVAVVVSRAVQLWDVSTGKRLQTFIGFEKEPSLYWNTDSSRLLITKWGKVGAVWFVQAGTMELQPLVLERNLRTVSWSPVGKLLLTTHSGALVDVWDAQKLTRLFELKLNKELIDARWSPDERSIMTLTRDGGWKAEWKLTPHSWVQLWDAESGQEKFTITLKGLVERAEFNADGKYILTVGGWDVPQLWDAASGNLHVKMKPPWCANGNCGTNYAELSRDGSLVVTGSSYSSRKETWDVVSGKFLALVETEKGNRFYIRGLSPDAQLVAVYRQHFKSWKSFAEESSIQLHDTRTGRLKVELTGRNMMWSAHQIVWSSDSKTLVTAGGSHGYQGKIWDVATGKLRADLELIAKEGHVPFTSYFNDLDELSFHPMAPVLIGTSQKLLKFWDPANGELLQTIAASSSQWNKTGGLLVTIRADKKSLLLWELVN